jgi:hypothetical protein
VIQETPFEGHRCIRFFGRDGSELLVTIDRGPRIISYVATSGRNLLAVLPRSGLDGPGGRFNFHGGHRLWVAPEDPSISHLPDDLPCRIDEGQGVVKVTAPDNGSGLERSLVLEGKEHGFRVDHQITNVGDKPITVGCWAITQFDLGGVALLPFAPESSSHQLRASHALVFWPYSSPDDPRLGLASDLVTVHGTPQQPPFKVGIRPGTGALGYFRDGEVFVKVAEPPVGDSADLGASSQVYAGVEFLELETLGALEAIQQGGHLSHREEWRSSPADTVEEAVEIVKAAV